ncbi:hypothetical protein FB45DRAFT_556466 [Roridomyces roridus]|uniref:F-box domain-containing protein n=1 Tax=Roridomyces roridus TaxID=1738132 RepID=A0AAD7FP02_9AGAR|nr:hypothetical protein FB45DRAFT_556466 [Roridomyces roridus]
MSTDALTPIACLPPEILAEIFVRCVPVTVRAVHADQDLSWLNVVRVSSRWRDIALGCPDFWSTLVFSRPKSIPDMLARSKMASLIVRADLKKVDNVTPVVLENAARLGILDMRFPQRDLRTFLSALEDADAAPRLQCIRLVNTTANLVEGGMWLPSDLFRRTAVSKSQSSTSVSLHLEACAFSWDSAWYSHLKHLHLERISAAQCPSMEALLGILLESRLTLETLAMVNCSPSTNSGFPVDLPRLTSLTLKTSSTLEPLLTYLIIPPSATLDISCGITSRIDKERREFYQSLIVTFSTAPRRYDDVHIAEQSNSVEFSLVDSAHEWTRKLTIACPGESLAMMQFFVEHLDFARVSTLHLRNLSGPDSTFLLWHTMGRRMRAVRTVHVHPSLPNKLLEFLLIQAMLFVGVSDFRSCFSQPDPWAFRGPNGELKHAWPRLTRFSLHGINLGELQSSWDPVIPQRPAVVDLLRALLWARRAGQARIWQLEIEDCEDVFSADLAHLRLFADISYDGKGAKTVQKEDFGHDVGMYSVNVFADLAEYSAHMRASEE